MRLYIIALLFIFLTGCQTPVKNAEDEGIIAETKQWKKTQEIYINSCIEKGGIPIISPWDGRLVDCKFPCK